MCTKDFDLSLLKILGLEAGRSEWDSSLVPSFSSLPFFSFESSVLPDTHTSDACQLTRGKGGHGGRPRGHSLNRTTVVFCLVLNIISLRDGTLSCFLDLPEMQTQ